MCPCNLLDKMTELIAWGLTTNILFFTPFSYPLQAERYEVILEPGDLIFIPALWFHSTVALDCSVSVNVFWKNLDKSMYDPKDVYGNKVRCNEQLV